MLNQIPYYHRIIRKNVIAFGSIFNDITLLRYLKNSNTEIERFKVPLSYAPKETFIIRLAGDPKLQKNIQILLPRMSFEITSINYDQSRKLSSFNETFYVKSNSKLNYLRGGTPYNIGFDLNIYVRNVEDGTQIVEQILPFFNPDYTVSVNYIENMETKRDTPVILNDVSYSQEFEGEQKTVRYLIWTLSFTMKTVFYPGIAESSIIRKTVANTTLQIEGVSTHEYVVEDNYIYKLGELVYQGKDLATSTALGIVSKQIGNTVFIDVKTGVFQVNEKLYGYDTRISPLIIGDLNNPLQLVYQSATPNPANSAANVDFGFTDVLQEYPFIYPVTSNTTTYRVDTMLITSDTQLLTSDEQQ